MKQERRRLIRSFLLPFGFVLGLWLVATIGWVIDMETAWFGIFPRHVEGLTGILTAQLVHGDLAHLMSNSVPLLILGTLTFYFYPDTSKKALPFIYFLTGLAVWLFGRPVWHIGASGLVYGLAAFIFVSGIMRRDGRSLAISMFMIFMYGGLVWGVFPTEEGISWESHASGAVTGILFAVIFGHRAEPIPNELSRDLPDDDSPGIDYEYHYIPPGEREQPTEPPTEHETRTGTDG